MRNNREIIITYALANQVCCIKYAVGAFALCVNSGVKFCIVMKEKNSVTKANDDSGFVVILLYLSGLSPASLMLPALLACFGQLVSAQVLPPGSCPLPDPLEYTVLLPHPSDCSSFFSCSNGVPIEQHCLDGLHFNDEFKVCDWPDNANCVKRKLSRLYLTLDFVFSSNNDSIV
jgi:hypothetical protein